MKKVADHGQLLAARLKRRGTTVPNSVRVVAVPPALIEIHPQWRGHMYFVVGDQIIIVDRNHRIIAIIDV
jgi:hypothetical protein